MKLIYTAIVLTLGLGCAEAQSANCPVNRTTVYVGPPADQAKQISDLIKGVSTANTTVLLGPSVRLDFSSLPDSALPIQFARCVTLTSAVANNATDVRRRLSAGNRAGSASPSVIAAFPLANSSARTPGSPGPALYYGKHPNRPSKDSSDVAFLEARCSGGLDGEGAQMSGFRVIGPSSGDQRTFETGINIMDCRDVEVSNMEIANWGGTAVKVQNPALGAVIPDHDPAEILVRVHDNFIHNNQHSSINGKAEGYGVATSVAAWARIYQNVFDNNRHSIQADGNTGGYKAERNLVLKGGGYHNATFLGLSVEKYIHVIDAHGNDNCGVDGHPDAVWNCGDAGRSFSILDNAVQYKKTNAIKFRGQPKNLATIGGNYFARSDKDAAIDLYRDCCTVKVLGNNHYDVDGFGQYNVCDFDGDGVDDLFLATGVSWWFSSFGEFQWSFLRRDDANPKKLRFGYFDGDSKCDVLMETLPGNWFISSAGSADWRALGDFGHPLSEVQFGRFDPNVRDHRPGVTRQTTHAFWRRADGHWFVKPLADPRGPWKAIGSSSFPLDQLRFGDFNGDGVTDVLAVENGRWAISESGTGQWHQLNTNLNDPVQNLYIANMDADDNIDDLLKLERTYKQRQPAGTVEATLTWWRSRNGVEPWKVWQSYTSTFNMYDAEIVPLTFGFAGRFGAAPGGGTMIIDEHRRGMFYSAAEKAVGASPSWTSVYQY